MSDVPKEPGVYTVVDTIRDAWVKLSAQNIPTMPVPVMSELFIARDWVRIDPLCNNEYIEIGDGFFIIKVEKNIAWWNQYWCERTGESPEVLSWGDYVVPIGRYRVHTITEDWFMCALEEEYEQKHEEEGVAGSNEDP